MPNSILVTLAFENTTMRPVMSHWLHNDLLIWMPITVERVRCDLTYPAKTDTERTDGVFTLYDGDGITEGEINQLLEEMQLPNHVALACAIVIEHPLVKKHGLPLYRHIHSDRPVFPPSTYEVGSTVAEPMLQILFSIMESATTGRDELIVTLVASSSAWLVGGHHLPNVGTLSEIAASFAAIENQGYIDMVVNITGDDFRAETDRIQARFKNLQNVSFAKS